jgi:DNA-binding transcriptional MerR regulator
MRISEAADRCGLSIHTIRYYEQSSLLPVVARGSDGRRQFSSEDIEWLILLASLRDTGMPMERMRRFAEFYQQGNDSIPERRQMLLDHSAQLDVRRAELDHCTKLLSYKLQKYSEIEGQ